MARILETALLNLLEWPNGYHEAWLPKTMAKLEIIGFVEKKQIINSGRTHGAWFLTPTGLEAVTQIKAGGSGRRFFRPRT